MEVDFFHKEFRIKRQGFPDLLRYESMITPGIVLGKGGELIATFKYRGPDMQCSSIGELNYLRLRVSQMINKLGAGWMLHSTALRKESVHYKDGEAFPDPVTRAIEKERVIQYRQEGVHYENEFFLTFTYLPDKILISQVKEFAYESEVKERMSPAKIIAKSIEYFENQLTDFVATLENSMNNKMHRLAVISELDPKSRRQVLYSEQLQFLHECITGKSHPVRIPTQVIPTGVDYAVGSYGFSPGIRPMLDGRYIRVVAIESPPDEGTEFGMLEVLNTLGVSIRWTTRWIARDTESAKSSVRLIRSKWRQKIRGFIADVMGRTTGPVNQDAANMASDAEAVLNDLESGDVSYGQWTSVVVLHSQSQQDLDIAVRFILKHIGAQGFIARDEDVNCTEAFLGSLPGHGYENVRKPEIHSMNLADCLPLTSTWQGPIENPCSFYRRDYDGYAVPPLLQGSASGGTPFRVVLHNGDVGHTFVGGPTGAGKSTLLALMAAQQFRYPYAQVFAFEKGESLLVLCLAAGGSHYNFLDESPASKAIGFAPFAKLDRLTDRIWAVDYIETILILNGVKVDLDVSSEITRAINLLQTQPVNLRSITNLNQLIQLRDVQAVLSQYENDYAGGMLNAKADNISTSKFMVFEMEKLMEMSDKHVVPVLLYLFRVVERALDGSPTMIILDEGWLLLKHPMFAEKLVEWLKVLRKANALVIFATQELQDVANSLIASTIFSSCQTKILLPNASAQSTDNTRLYKEIGLTEREIELLAYGMPKRDYFFTSPAGRRLFQLELGPVALAFVAASGTEDRKVAKELYFNHGPRWVLYWLKRKGLDDSILDSGGRFAMH